MERKCAVCGVIGSQSCGGCSKVSYCSREHQKQHWKTHKKDCSFFAIEDTPEMGKGFVATRDIKPGTVILEEIPAIGAPDWEDKALSSEPCCITCGFVMKETRRVCSKCEWPACSPECENDPAHAFECQEFLSTNFKFPPVRSPLKETMSSKFFMMIIRVLLLKRKDPDLYAQIAQLQSEYEIGTNGVFELFRSSPGFTELIEELIDWLRTSGLEVSFEEGIKLPKTILINSFSARSMKPASIDAKHPTLWLLYLKTSRMNTSCIPNCCWKISEKPERKMKIWTATAVKKGEPLTMSLDMRHYEVGTRQRQEGCQQGAGFICKCIRCTDPTELGTFMSGLVCSDCYAPDMQDRGYFLPQVPWDVSKTAIWECNGCGKTVALSTLFQVENLADEIAQMVKSVQENRVDFLTLEEFCENLIAKYGGKVLHPNHWVVQDAARALFDLALKHVSSFDIAAHERIVQHGLYLLAIQDKVSPGFSIVRARRQQAVSHCLSQLAVKLMCEHDYEMAARHIDRALTLLNEVLEYRKKGLPGPELEGMESEKVQENMDKNWKQCMILMGLKAKAVACGAALRCNELKTRV